MTPKNREIERAGHRWSEPMSCVFNQSFQAGERLLAPFSPSAGALGERVSQGKALHGTVYHKNPSLYIRACRLHGDWRKLLTNSLKCAKMLVSLWL